MGNAIPHRADRPSWTCRHDGRDWPCWEAHKQLRRAFPPGSTVLTRHLLGLLAIAADDLAVTCPASLYWRFAAWTLPAGTLCRSCGKRGHDTLPGVPLRLIPCHAVPASVRVASADAGRS
jgi:hypothetical protein